MQKIENPDHARAFIAHARKQCNATAGTDTLDDIIKELMNCREVEVDEDGFVWVAGPQQEHWLNGHDTTKLANRIHQRDGAWMEPMP